MRIREEKEGGRVCLEDKADWSEGDICYGEEEGGREREKREIAYRREIRTRKLGDKFHILQSPLWSWNAMMKSQEE